MGGASFIQEPLPFKFKGEAHQVKMCGVFNGCVTQLAWWVIKWERPSPLHLNLLASCSRPSHLDMDMSLI